MSSPQKLKEKWRGPCKTKCKILEVIWLILFFPTMNLLLVFLHFGMFSSDKCCFAGMHDHIPFIYNTPREMHARLLMEEDIEEFKG